MWEELKAIPVIRSINDQIFQEWNKTWIKIEGSEYINTHSAFYVSAVTIPIK